MRTAIRPTLISLAIGFSAIVTAAPASSAHLGVRVVVNPSCRVTVGTANALQNGRGNKIGVELKCVGRAEQSARAANSTSQPSGDNPRAFDIATPPGAAIEINF